MRAYCETFTREVLPAIRAMIAQKLIRELGMKQSETAELLGVTQATISHYINLRRGKVAVLLQTEEVASSLSEIVEKIAREREPITPSDICQICRKTRLHLVAQSLNPSKKQSK